MFWGGFAAPKHPTLPFLRQGLNSYFLARLNAGGEGISLSIQVHDLSGMHRLTQSSSWIGGALGIFLLVLLAGSWLLSLLLTGRVPRAYPVLDPHTTLEIDGRSRTVAGLARDYQPLMHIRSSTPSPPLLWVWYEAVATPETLDLVYFHVWRDEIHPNALVDGLYRMFRAAYYGLPPYDVEYFQVTVSREDGEVAGLMFETSPERDFYPQISEHLVAHLSRRADGSWLQALYDQSGNPVAAPRVRRVAFENHRVRIGAQTWNHLTELVPETGAGYDRLLEAEPRPLTAAEYTRHKFARKSQGSHRTTEDRTLVWLIFVGLAGLSLVGTRLISSMMHREKRNAGE